jgi:hypothetical protein
MMGCKSQPAAGSSRPLDNFRWVEMFAGGRPENTASSWLNRGAKVVVSRLRMPGIGDRRMNWRSRLGRIVETQVARPGFG